jgi:serine/threonine protein phosphatase PrpC
LIISLRSIESNDIKGSNGHKAAAFAKTHFPTLIEKAQAEILASPPNALSKLFAEINDNMNEDTTVDTYMSGTTAAIAIITNEGRLITANVGDTRIISMDDHGKPRLLTM